MSTIDLNDLQADIQGRLTFTTLTDYIHICQNFLQFIKVAIFLHAVHVLRKTIRSLVLALHSKQIIFSVTLLLSIN